MIPSPWVALVLALAAFRLTRLIGWDDLPPIVRVRRWATGETVHYNTTQQPGPIYRWRRPMLAHFLGCAFCQGWWTSLAVYGVWLVAGAPGHIALHSWVLYGLAPFALSSFVGLVAKNLDP